MKRFSEKIILITMLCLTITGCKKHEVISGRQEILFQYEYVNYAWGYQHNGFIIDSEGNILTYNNPQNWNYPDNDLNLTEKQVNENISLCKISGKRISPEELTKFSGYIKNISLSKITAIKNVSADAGSYEYICFRFSESTGTYNGYLIKKEGDFTCENLNFFSKKVASWMRNINNSLIKK